MEIFLDGVCGTINYVGADYNDARVVCRQLGYNTFSKTRGSNDTTVITCVTPYQRVGRLSM